MSNLNELNQNLIILDKFLKQKDFEGLVETTQMRLSTIVKKFFQDVNKNIKDINSQDVYDWWTSNYKNHGIGTQNTYLSYVSSFMNYCVYEEIIERTPIKMTWRKKRPLTTPKYIDNTEMARIQIHTEDCSLRERTIIEFLRCTGVRRQELCNLSIKDVNLHENRAKVLGKGGIRRTVNFNEECKFLLNKLIDGRNPDEPLFINRFGKRISTISIHRITTIVGSVLRLKRSLHPHRFRHYYASYLAANGARINFIAKKMGHTQLSSTQIYTSIPSSKRKQLYLKYVEWN